MIFSILRRFLEEGLLGINRRNAEYIMRCNPRSAYPLVDDKILTKRLAEERRIPTPSLYHVVEYHGDAEKLRESLSELRSFVLKPARGVGGSGIVLITDRKAGGFVMQSGETLSWADLSYHMSDILSGIHSLSGLEDRAFFEALVRPDPVFAAVTYEGVPDIRVIVYRGVPVMGMARLPTRGSDGKANLHRGAIGVGIDIGTGRTLRGVHGAEVVTHHPDTGHPLSGIRVPHWEVLLLIAASALDMTGLCYLGVDMVIDRERGPMLLELNARPGLAIQIANLAGLRKRLEQVDRASPGVFVTPESRIAWARKTFGVSDR